MKKSYSIQEICAHLRGELAGNKQLEINGVEFIDSAQPGHLTFIGQKKYLNLWPGSSASAAIIDKKLGLEPDEGRALIRVDNADLAMAEVLEMFAPQPPSCDAGVHPTAFVHSAAKLGEGTAIGPQCYIGAGASIGSGARLYGNVSVMDESIVGDETVLYPGVVIRERCTVGNHCIIHPNVTIGSDGFGYRPAADGSGYVKIVHIGTVEIGNRVEIGAGTCIDRGKFSATVIGDGTKIDNLVQIAHNCKIGRSCAISALSGLSGSVTVGDGVIMGGNVGVADHVHIHEGAMVGGKTGVMRDVPAGQAVLGYPAWESKQTLRMWAALPKLPDALKKMGSRDNDR